MTGSGDCAFVKTALRQCMSGHIRQPALAQAASPPHNPTPRRPHCPSHLAPLVDQQWRRLAVARLDPVGEQVPLVALVPQVLRGSGQGSRGVRWRGTCEDPLRPGLLHNAFAAHSKLHSADSFQHVGCAHLVQIRVGDLLQRLNLVHRHLLIGRRDARQGCMSSRQAGGNRAGTQPAAGLSSSQP